MTYSAEIMADRPAAYYRMGEAAYPTTPKDMSGNGNHVAAIVDFPVYAQTGAISDRDTAILFPATGAGGAYFKANDSTTLDLGDVFTLEAWVKLNPTGVGSNCAVVCKGANAYELTIDSDGSIDLQKNGVGIIVLSTALITDSIRFHHVVATKNGAAVKLYLDGVDVTGSVTNRTCTDTATELFIGVESHGVLIMDGTMDEVALYPTALSAGRVLAHFQAQYETGLRSQVAPHLIGAR